MLSLTGAKRGRPMPQTVLLRPMAGERGPHTSACLPLSREDVCGDQTRRVSEERRMPPITRLYSR